MKWGVSRFPGIPMGFPEDIQDFLSYSGAVVKSRPYGVGGSSCRLAQYKIVLKYI